MFFFISFLFIFVIETTMFSFQARVFSYKLLLYSVSNHSCHYLYVLLSSQRVSLYGIFFCSHSSTFLRSNRNRLYTKQIPVNHSIFPNLLESLEVLATASPILLIMWMYSATCLLTGFLGPQEEATEDCPVLTLLLDWEGIFLKLSSDLFLFKLVQSGLECGFCIYSVTGLGVYFLPFPIKTTSSSSSSIAGYLLPIFFSDLGMGGLLTFSSRYFYLFLSSSSYYCFFCSISDLRMGWMTSMLSMAASSTLPCIFWLAIYSFNLLSSLSLSSLAVTYYSISRSFLLLISSSISFYLSFRDSSYFRLLISFQTSISFSSINLVSLISRSLLYNSNNACLYLSLSICWILAFYYSSFLYLSNRYILFCTYLALSCYLRDYYCSRCFIQNADCSSIYCLSFNLYSNYLLSRCYCNFSLKASSTYCFILYVVSQLSESVVINSCFFTSSISLSFFELSRRKYDLNCGFLLST